MSGPAKTAGQPEKGVVLPVFAEGELLMFECCAECDCWFLKQFTKISAVSLEAVES